MNPKFRRYHKRTTSFGLVMAKRQLQAPFPYFGGKAKIASAVWERLGDVDNYVEPFGGSLAVLLARPDSHEWWMRKETAGDYSGMIVNVFRAIKSAPDEVAKHANWPVSEADLTARHLFLLRYEADLTDKLMSDPEYFDAKAAAWWIWGVSSWVGGDWMTGKGPYNGGVEDGIGVYRKLPMVAGSHGGKGLHKPPKGIPINSTLEVELALEERYAAIFEVISNRLRRVRLTCGDWKRLTNSAVTPVAGKQTGIFLDPPYDMAKRRSDLYGKSDSRNASTSIHDESRKWALENGDRPELRIAYCGYDDDQETKEFLESGWTGLRWTASGGYGLQSETSRARSNRDREIIWFSPFCLNSSSQNGV